MIRRVLICAVALVYWTGTGCASGMTITMSRNQLQRRVEERFPIEKNLLAASVELTDPEIILQPGLDKIGIKMVPRVRLIGGKTFEGKLAVLGDLYYEPEDGLFYLHHAQLVQFEIDGLPEGLRHPVTTAINIGLSTVLQAIPIYALHTSVETSAKMFIKTVRVEDGEVLVIMDW